MRLVERPMLPVERIKGKRRPIRKPPGTWPTSLYVGVLEAALDKLSHWGGNWLTMRDHWPPNEFEPLLSEAASIMLWMRSTNRTDENGLTLAEICDFLGVRVCVVMQRAYVVLGAIEAADVLLSEELRMEALAKNRFAWALRKEAQHVA